MHHALVCSRMASSSRQASKARQAALAGTGWDWELGTAVFERRCRVMRAGWLAGWRELMRGRAVAMRAMICVRCGRAAALREGWRVSADYDSLPESWRSAWLL
jgi:hypothetical protein